MKERSSKEVIKDLKSIIEDKDNPVDIIIFEGYEMTGKSHLQTELYSEVSTDNPTINYEPQWFDGLIARGNRYMIGLIALEFFSSVRKISPNLKVFLNRWLPSSYVYKVKYNQESDCKSIWDVVQSESELLKDMNVLIIHKYHSSKDEARIIYDMSVKDSEHQDQYDRFVDFDQYYEAYQEFEKLFQEFYHRSGFKVIQISSYYNYRKED